jgi:hypothetical protein
MATDHFDHR